MLKPAAGSNGPKLPQSVDQIRLEKTERLTVYMPFGFLPFDDYDLGNGDCFGLYWPIGKEQQEPLVAETLHDEGRIDPAFSSLDSFLAKAAQLNKHGWFGERPSINEDPASPVACYEAARAALTNQDFDNAVALLEKAVATLPEYTDALAALAAQYRRLQRHDDACRVAVQMIMSPPSFGYSTQVGQIAGWFAKQTKCPDDLSDNPIWLGRAKLVSIPTGGSKDSDAYPIVREAIDTFVARGDIVRALTLMQTYADFMDSETKALQERHGFNLAEHRKRQKELSRRLPGGSRNF